MLCSCTIYFNTEKIIEKQQEVFGIITEMNQIVAREVKTKTNYSIKDSKYFYYKTSITGKLEGNNTEKKTEIVPPLTNFSNWRTLDMQLINCEINIMLIWSENCVLSSKATRNAVPALGGNPAVTVINNPTNAIFEITDIKLYVSVLTLFTENNKTLLQQFKTGFKRTIKWNKCRPEMTNQAVNNNLSYLNDPIFTNVNRLFVLSFETEDDRTSFSKHYVPNVQIKELNALTLFPPRYFGPISNQGGRAKLPLPSPPT